MDLPGNEIASLRKEKGITQAKLAALAGVGQATISRIESEGNATRDVRLLMRIARALDASLSDILPNDLQDSLVSQSQGENFYAFCQNPLCSANRLDEGPAGTTVSWKSGGYYRNEEFLEINYCEFCGDELVKECPECSRRLERPGAKHCITCGTKLYDRPTKEDWTKIRERLAAAKREGHTFDEDDIPF